MGDSSLKTLLVGIDAACDRVLTPMFEDGVLPTLNSIYREGVNGPLESQIPPWTASAWPSLYTGKNPGKHGVFGFLSFEGYDWEVVNATDVREKAVWELLSEHGITSVIVNVPVTHPPQDFDGALIPGYTAPENPDCHPEGVLPDVRDAIDEYRVYPDDDATDRGDAYSECARMRGEAFRYLVDRFEPEFGFVQFQGTDSIFHKEPTNDTAIRKIYREVDRQLAEIMDAHDPETVIVASDHGMGPVDGYEFRVNEYLRREGFVATENGGRGMPAWSTIRENALKRGDDTTHHEPGLLERAMATAARTGLTSQRIGAALERLHLEDLVATFAPAELVNAGATQVDFPSSSAYMRSRVELGVRLNLEGREPTGVVPAAEYETVRTQIIDVLRSARTPEGEPVFEAVERSEEFFHGPESEKAVDIVTIPADFDHYLSATLRDEQFGAPPEPWNHKREGTIAVHGAAIDAGAGLGAPHLFDVAPTVLATLDVPIDDRMDGQPLPCVDTPGTESYSRLDQPETVATESDAVTNRLADLGYIE